MRAIVLYVVDSILAVATLASFLIIATGGGVFFVAEHRISAHHTTNLLWGLFLLGVPRFIAFPDVAFLGFSSIRGRGIPAQCRRFCHTLYDWLNNLSSRSSARVVGVILLLSLSIKVLNAWYFYGFYSGDDVEIHEMSLAHILDWSEYEAWRLRSAFYPMAFIYPVQVLMHNFGVESEALLVFGGRLVVVGFSLLALFLAYEATRVRYRSIPIALVATVLLAGSKLHTTFAASVLPRSVAAVFCLLAFWLLSRFAGNAAAVASGVALGVGASLRFGEGIFILAAVIDLALQRQFVKAAVVSLVSAATAGLIIGVADWLYWGEAFASVQHLVRFTLIDQLSTRGYQPFYYYLASVGSWSNVLFLVLVIQGIRLRRDGAVLWGVVPIVALSLLPHKEARYLVPAMPFLAMVAGFAIWHSLESIRNGSRLGGFRLLSMPAVLLVVVGGSLLFELDGMRFRRTESSVDAARMMSERADASSVAVQDVWTAGGRIYLWRVANVINLATGHQERSDLKEFEFVSLRADPVDDELWREVEEGPFSEIELPRAKSYFRYHLFERQTVE